MCSFGTPTVYRFLKPVIVNLLSLILSSEIVGFQRKAGIDEPVCLVLSCVYQTEHVVGYCCATDSERSFCSNRRGTHIALFISPQSIYVLIELS